MGATVGQGRAQASYIAVGRANSIRPAVFSDADGDVGAFLQRQAERPYSLAEAARAKLVLKRIDSPRDADGLSDHSCATSSSIFEGDRHAPW